MITVIDGPFAHRHHRRAAVTASDPTFEAGTPVSLFLTRILAGAYTGYLRKGTSRSWEVFGARSGYEAVSTARRRSTNGLLGSLPFQCVHSERRFASSASAWAVAPANRCSRPKSS